MFLRKDKKTYASGRLLVPFCKDCDSQDIETIQTCRKCGSHNITADWLDKRSEKIQFDTKEVYIYKCDNCGKEFDYLEAPNIISLADGEFLPYKYESEYGEADKIITLKKDLCNDCKKKLVNKLNLELDLIAKDDHIKDVLDNMIDTKECG